MSAIKIVLGKRPVSIHRVVTFQLPEGGEGVIEVDFKYRTRTEVAQLIDEHSAQAREAATAAVAEEAFEITNSRITSSAIRAQSNFLGQVLVGWNLDVPLNADTIKQLCDELPGAAQALLDAHRVALAEGRSGN